MKIARSVFELREMRPRLGANIGLVPTMGGLHAGHHALIRAANAENPAVMVTIFLNPKQFNDNSDLVAYPSNIEKDLEFLYAEGVDLAFIPNAQEIYPPGFQTEVHLPKLSRDWEAEQRPGHFVGVATVVTILLNLAGAATAYFGQKDAQQVAIIRRLIHDLRLPTTTQIIPTVRESDGLAFSSRNSQIPKQLRPQARALFGALKAAGREYEAGERNDKALRRVMRANLLTETNIVLNYESIVSAKNFRALEGNLHPECAPLALVACELGPIRLIDNMLLPIQRNNRAEMNAVLGLDW